MHDPKYDKYEYYATFGETMDKSDAYTGLPLDNKICTKAIRVYPSQSMEDEYRTNESVAFAICAGAIFLFITLVFVIYECIVAMRLSWIVDDIREHMEEMEEGNEGKDIEQKAPAEQAPARETKSVATLHNDTTVLYASLVGFNEWSANRSP